MTDTKKILKALDSCILHNPDDHCRCDDCPYREPECSNCVNRLKMDAYELIMANEIENRPAKPLIVTDYPDQFGNRRTMYICGACQKSIVDGANYCMECGRRVQL